MGAENESDRTPETELSDEDDDFPWDAPIHVVHQMPIVDSLDQVPEGHTAVPVEWIQDERLSLGARGLLVEILAHGGEWDIDAEGIAALGPKGEFHETADEIRVWIAELEEHGYLEPSGQ
ncbi:hypothetical protein [Streptomyces turgidiscabies]|uniref:hypothetical protein n=1 Tax=Streptomyces turgidiscabies TaxID=85558 RepID=UPI0038F76013